MKFFRISTLLFLLAALTLTGCGTYQVTYIHSKAKAAEKMTRLNYAHGVGLVGGGLYFFAMHRMAPCWIDYTGPVNLEKVCPNGFYQIEQWQPYGLNARAAFISWLILLNVYHQSDVDITHALPTTVAGK